ncbi:sensor histidine kinase [Flagellimonas pacifica]|uniref:histidine kinase n=1 Tax=Flagellimonas pacifica TaxID=1247520 RepID=A0A285MCR0_9FLAO|nr:PAS domain-containing sensor histidine kinase [Allomuricauda parva]SNY94940.1 PAS domain S-box-containing protein [Allomuricauda parva]
MKTNCQPTISIEDLPFPIVVLDKKLEILRCSQIFFDFFELAHSNCQSLTLKEVIGELPISFSKILNRKTFLNKELKEFTAHVTRKHELKWFKMVLYPSQKEKCYYLYFDDVTQKKKTIDLSLQAERAARIGSWEVDLVNHTVFWSDMTREIHETPRSHVPNLETGINFYKEGKHRERIIEVVSECIEKGTPYDEELILVTAKGNQKWVRAIGNSEMINGKASRMFGVFQDIDKEKRASIEYQILTDRMRVAVESSNIGIWDYNIIDNVLVWDDNMYNLYGVKKEDFSGEVAAWETTIHPNDKDRSIQEVEMAIRGEKEFNTQFRIITPEGSIRHIHGQGKVFKNKHGNPVRMVGANADITRIKKVDNRLRQLLNITEKQNKNLLNFAHIVSHNLRSNSSNLSMLTGMLLDNTDPKSQEKFLEMIRISSERLDETVVQLNEIIKIQSDQGKNLQWVKVEPALKNALESINAHIEETDPDISIQIHKELKVYAIKPYLSSIFLNLLTNSIKYRRTEEKLKIKISAKTISNQTIISFKDNGQGIDLKKHGEKLFGMYKTFHGNSDAKGIGLFISKNQMDAMNAIIDVESEVNKGTIFNLCFTNKTD